MAEQGSEQTKSLEMFLTVCLAFKNAVVVVEIGRGGGGDHVGFPSPESEIEAFFRDLRMLFLPTRERRQFYIA